MEIRDTQYARAADGAYIAYQVIGDGPIDLVWQFDWFGSLDVLWEDPQLRSLFTGLSRISRLILHDRRATGLSSRNVAVPNLETRVADLLCVLDAVGSERPVLIGRREGGSPNILLAATEPERCRSLVWCSPLVRSVWTPEYRWGVRSEYVESDQRALELWGTSDYGKAWIDTEAITGHQVEELTPGLAGLLSRNTATPDVARELARVWFETDVREAVRSVRIPTLLLAYEKDEENVAEAAYIASSMEAGSLETLPGSERDDRSGKLLVDAVGRFIGVEASADIDTVLTTVLFTDIVGSTERQAALGDRGWKELIGSHHGLVRSALEKWRGSENDTAGDGFFATFDGPARAIRCALEITERVRELGIEVRAGLHTGECEVVDGKATGIAVSIGARISALADPSQVLISETVRGLVAGSGFKFEGAGEHALKGIPDRWHLYRVVDG